MSTATIPTKSQDSASEGLEGVVLPISWRDPIVSALMALLTVIIALVSHADSNVSYEGASGWFTAGVVAINAPVVNWIMAVITIIFTALTFKLAVDRKKVPGWFLVVTGVAFVVAFLLMSTAGRPDAKLPVVSLTAISARDMVPGRS